MSDWNPATVEAAIHECSQRIANGVMKADAAYRKFLDSDHAYDLAFARAYLDADGPAHAKKYMAEIATEAERKARNVADAAYKLMDRNMKAIQSELDALRSIGTSVRQAYAVAGRGEY
ncbi:hypothetical protein DQP57_00510 [Mycobacterium colombiense]|uniref:ESX-1 secretion-associated protein n=1 Tax=Mycobacterium colombiense TaxID=339268 RepID=A0A329MC16_9MYCO|nr:hypothetical protein [Mycobacterium colombiense]RAV17541.1 hypothetical protein DQP57_00510 [Mycobacterium colombiense]